MEGVPSNKKTFLTEGMMLAIVPAVVYFLAYEYEMGFIKAFNAPEDLVSVDITSIITFGIASLGLYMVLYNVVSSLWYSHFMNITEMSWKQLLLKSMARMSDIVG